MDSSSFEKLVAYFERPVAQQATAPLKNGVELAIILDDNIEGTLTKTDGTFKLTQGKPAKPDMTFLISSLGVEELVRTQSDDIADTGISIARLMVHSDPKLRLKAKVHIGGFTLLTHGYLGVIPLGGKRLMQFLAEKGVGSIGKIKDILGSLRN